MGSGESKAEEIASAADRHISTDELALHNKWQDCWIVIKGIVYDVSGYIDAHPGGRENLLQHAGADGTRSFEDIGASALLPPSSSLTPTQLQVTLKKPFPALSLPSW
jgi:cytochrome b involved in lipid metabolism